jgi:hypothetical protein
VKNITYFNHSNDYAAYEREALAVVARIKYFRSYLLNRTFLVYTDNTAVASLFRLKSPTGPVVRWIDMMQEFDFELHHRSSKNNVVPIICLGLFY